MEFSKFKLEKNWLESENYRIYNNRNQLCGSSVKHGFFKVSRYLLDVNGTPVFEVRKRGWGYDHDLLVDGTVKASVFRSSWGKPQYTLKIAGGNTYYITVTRWDKIFEFTDTEGNQVALGSAASSSLNSIGVAIGHEIEPDYVLTTIIVICRVILLIRGAG